jgi:spermidine/putrescine transport system permease protein
MNRSRIPVIITGLVIFVLYLPLLMLAINSFNEARFGGAWMGFSLKWYVQLMRERAMWNALRNSFLIACFVGIASTILGTLAALALYRYKTRWQKIHYGLIYTPLVIPDILMGIGLLLFFVAISLKLGLFTVFLAHTTFCMSYVTMIILARMQHFDYAIIEAAQDLGANFWLVFRKVIVPLLMPGIIAGFLLAFTLSIDDFVITYFVLGQGSTMLPVYIYSMIKFGSTPIINALSVILLAVTFIIVWITQHLIEEE